MDCGLIYKICRGLFAKMSGSTGCGRLTGHVSRRDRAGLRRGLWTGCGGAGPPVHRGPGSRAGLAHGGGVVRSCGAMAAVLWLAVAALRGTRGRAEGTGVQRGSRRGRCARRLRVRGPGRKRSTRRGGSAAVACSGEVAHVTERERTSEKGTGGFLTSTRSSGGGPRCRRRSGNEDSTAAEASSRRQWRRCLIPRVSRRGKETWVLGGGAGGCGVCFIGWGGSAILDSRAARTSGPVVAADSETAGGRG